jgi:hypothetical protein
VDRVTNVMDGLRIASMVGPAGPLESIRKVLASSPLNRGPSDIYRLHKEFVETMDAAQAKRLIELWDRLGQAAPCGKDLVTDVFPGA